MKRTLISELLESVATETASKPITEAQREVTRQRLAEYRANPAEPVATLSDIKRDLGLS